MSLNHEELKEKIKEWKKLEKEKAEISSKIKAIEAEINASVVSEMDEKNTNLIKNPLFTIERSISHDKEVILSKVLEDVNAKAFLFDYIENGGSIKIGAVKTFEKNFAKAGLTNFDDLCKIVKKEKISYEIRPDVPVEDAMEI